MSTIDPTQPPPPPPPRGSAAPDGAASEDWQEVLAAQEERVLGLVRAHPVATVAIAAAVGFLVARLIREDE